MAKEDKKVAEATRDYKVVSGSYSTYVTDDDGQRVRKKLRVGEVVKLTEDKAKRLIGIVVPVDYAPAKAVEAPVSVFPAKEESLRPMNEIGAGMPQNADIKPNDPEFADAANLDEMLAKGAPIVAQPAGTVPGIAPAKATAPAAKPAPAKAAGAAPAKVTSPAVTPAKAAEGKATETK